MLNRVYTFILIINTRVISYLLYSVYALIRFQIVCGIIIIIPNNTRVNFDFSPVHTFGAKGNVWCNIILCYFQKIYRVLDLPLMSSRGRGSLSIV